MSLLLAAWTSLAALSTVASAQRHPDLPDRPVCVAHRGAFVWCENEDGEREKCKEDQRVENSRLSIESALDVGAPAVEFDVRTTRDGVPILLHGKRVRSVARDRGNADCPRGKKVAKLTWDELNLACELKSAEAHDDDQSIWTLEQALDHLDSKGRYVLVELKDGPHPRTLELLEAHQRHNEAGLVVIAFRSWRLDVVRAHFEAAGVPAPALLDLGFTSNAWSRYDGGGFRHRLIRRRQADDVRESGRLVDVFTLGKRPNRRLQYAVRPDFVTTNDLASCFEVYPPVEAPPKQASPEPTVEAEAPAEEFEVAEQAR